MQVQSNHFTAKKGPSWFAIIIMLIIFWPIGLYLLWKRIKNDKSLALGSGKITRGIGIFSLIIAFGGGISFVEDMALDTLIWTIVFALLGFSLFKMGQETKKRSVRIKRYISLIANQQMTNLDALASATGATYKVVIEDIEKLLNMGYFEGAYINKEQRRLIMPRVGGMPQRPNNNKAAAKTKAVTCKSCGASVIVAQGTTRKCEYCGSPVQG